MKNVFDSPRNMLRKLPFVILAITGGVLVLWFCLGIGSGLGSAFGIAVVALSLVYLVVKPDKEGK